MTATVPQTVVDRVSVEIRTDRLHHGPSRITAWQKAINLAAQQHRRVIGSWVDGPRIAGDLDAETVQLVWHTQPEGDPA